jgi:hypothetical protein
LQLIWTSNLSRAPSLYPRECHGRGDSIYSANGKLVCSRACRTPSLRDSGPSTSSSALQALIDGAESHGKTWRQPSLGLPGPSVRSIWSTRGALAAGDVGELLYRAWLFRADPDYAQHRNKRMRLVALTFEITAAVAAFARSRRVCVVCFPFNQPSRLLHEKPNRLKEAISQPAPKPAPGFVNADSQTPTERINPFSPYGRGEASRRDLNPVGIAKSLDFSSINVAGGGWIRRTLDTGVQSGCDLLGRAKRCPRKHAQSRSFSAPASRHCEFESTLLRQAVHDFRVLSRKIENTADRRALFSA